MAVKLLMTWDIRPGQEQEYFEFVVRDWIPGIQKMGLQPSQAWFTMYGDQPQIMAEALMPNIQDLQTVLDSSPWDDLKIRLLDQINTYRTELNFARSLFMEILSGNQIKKPTGNGSQ